MFFYVFFSEAPHERALVSRRPPHAYTSARLGPRHMGSRSRSAQGRGGDIARFHHGLAHNLQDLGAAVDGQESSRKLLTYFSDGGGGLIFSVTNNCYISNLLVILVSFSTN